VEPAENSCSWCKDHSGSEGARLYLRESCLCLLLLLLCCSCCCSRRRLSCIPLHLAFLQPQYQSQKQSGNHSQ
jgi:hypothetical protein